MRLPKTKNGPKGIDCPKCFFPEIIKKIEKIAPVRKDNINATKDRGNPKANPINPPSFTSPPPIPLPLVKIISKVKKPAIAKPETMAPNKD